MKKISITLLVIILLFNFIYSNINFVYADNNVTNEANSSNAVIEYTQEDDNSAKETGTADIDGTTKSFSISASIIGTVAGAFASFLYAPCMTVENILSFISIQGGFKRSGTEYSASETGWFSVYSLVFDEYQIFDMNVYSLSSDVLDESEQTAVSKLMDSLKTNVVGYFSVMRYVALALFLVLIIFSLIRLSVSTLAEDRARYKEAIKSWVGALIFMFMLPTIISAIGVFFSSISDALYEMRTSLENAGYSSFEIELVKMCREKTAQTSGFKSFAYLIELAAFVVFQVKFFLKYIYRVFKALLLVFLSPIIVVLHMFDKMKGGDGMIMEWIKQYTMLVIIQPIHAITYCIFILTASEIAMNAPLLGVVFIWALFRAEKIIEAILNINQGKIGTMFKKA